MLVLAGGGLYPGHFTKELVDVLRSASLVLVETYTMPGAGWLVEEVEKHASGRVIVATRSMLEEGIHDILSEASRSLVVVITAGDPLVATTHRALLSEASRMGVEYRVLHGISGVCTAKIDSGLDYYKYGRTITVPGPWRGVKAYSVLWYTYSNMCIGLHTLLLLDVDDDGNQLNPGEAAEILLSLEEHIGLELLAKTPALIIWNSGLDDVLVEAHTLGSLSKLKGEARGIASIAVPGNLSQIEAEHLYAMYKIKLDPAFYRGLQPKACSALDKLKNHI